MKQKLLFIIICFSVLVISCDEGEWWTGEYAKLKGANYVNNNTLSIQYIVNPDLDEYKTHVDFYNGVLILRSGSDDTLTYNKKDRTSPVTDKNGRYVINVKVSPDFISGYEISVVHSSSGKTISFTVP